MRTQDYQVRDLGSTGGFAALPLVVPFATLQLSRQAVATSPMTSTQPPPAAAPDPPNGAAPITLDRNSEARRAYRESRTAIMLLQQRWPAAFPETPQQVRPLIAGLTPLIAAALDWSHPYTRAVLRTWKLRPAYCRAVLVHPVRFDLDGNPTDQPVNEDARTMAKTRLDTWASKRRQPVPHKPPGDGGGTTAFSPTQAPDSCKPADTATAPALSRRRSILSN
jgi:sRNA-binding protein